MRDSVSRKSRAGDSEIQPQLVSVIIPVYNRPAMLREAVTSVLAQAYRPIEIIIVDDGSTDETPEAVDELAESNPSEIRVIHQENQGPGLAREAGRQSARGEFVQYLDSDDLLLPRKFELQVAALTANPGFAVSYGKTREYLVGEVTVDQPARRTGESLETIFPAALAGRLWATETPLFRRSALDGIGPWSGLRVLEDWEYECRLGAKGARLHYCDEFVSNHRHHRGAREGLRWQAEDDAFRDMLTAHLKVLGYARKAGISHGTRPMQNFARNLFRLARDAGRRGLTREARSLLEEAVDIDCDHRGEYRLYGLAASILGWRRAADWAERFAKKRRNSDEQSAVPETVTS